MKRTFLPLASNAGWFERDTLFFDLERRLKVLLLTHDELVIDDGSFRFAVADSGLVEQPLAPRMITRDRRDLGFLTGQHDVPASVLLSLAIDFVPIVARAGIADLSGISWSEQALVPSVKRALRAHVDALARAPEVVAALPISQGERDALVKNWLFDAALAHSMGASTSVDAKGARFVDALNVAIQRLALPKEAAALTSRRVAFSFALRDVDAMTWPTVLALRASAHGAWLRTVVATLAERALSCAAASPEPVYALSVSTDEQQQIDRAVGKDPYERSGTAAVFALSFAPLVGVEVLGNARFRSWVLAVGSHTR